MGLVTVIVIQIIAITINDHFGDNDGDCDDDGAGIVGDNGDGEGNEVDGKQESRRVASVLARFMLKLEGEPALKCERRNTG